MREKSEKYFTFILVVKFSIAVICKSCTTAYYRRKVEHAMACKCTILSLQTSCYHEI